MCYFTLLNLERSRRIRGAMFTICWASGLSLDALTVYLEELDETWCLHYWWNTETNTKGDRTSFKRKSIFVEKTDFKQDIQKKYRNHAGMNGLICKGFQLVNRSININININIIYIIFIYLHLWTDMNVYRNWWRDNSQNISAFQRRTFRSKTIFGN